VTEQIACSLNASQAAERAEHTAALAARALRAREDLARGERLRFEAGSDIETALREVIAAEGECCPFLGMELRRGHDELVLEITGPPEARPIISALFA
jgi:hypothetical protein